MVIIAYTVCYVNICINEPWVYEVLAMARLGADLAAVVRCLGANWEERVRPTCEEQANIAGDRVGFRVRVRVRVRIRVRFRFRVRVRVRVSAKLHSL